ncbi:RibD family protein [Salinicola sp. RZ23]|uniref:RibD family protein n=1 Tax=Salinicola sp. RZ23 TaxID=1949087 RepID=UPI000DA1DA1F|nr:RibD family protein [Salinicola sp. RZ23]
MTTSFESAANIDTPLAWRWIRDIAAATRRQRFDGRIERDGVRLEVDAGGGWRSDARVDAEAAQLLSIWLPWCVADLSHGPQLIAQLGQSLDGRIATVTGASHYVTGQASLVHLHRTRALVDAVVVGAGTVEADDPQLTVRHVEGDNPLRVVLDPRARVCATRGVFTRDLAPTWHLVAAARAEQAAADRARQGASHVSVKPLQVDAAGADPADVVALLAEGGCRRILVEGGGLTISRFLEAGQLDRLHSVVAPMIIGSGRPALTLPEIETLDRALRPACRHFTLGEDMLFDVDLRRGAAT